MFKALDLNTGKEIVILDWEWLESIPLLRDMSAENLLGCPGCKQPVRVRAGEIYRPHFAHKQVKNCLFGKESALLQNTRAALYEWLRGKFGDKVIIEKQLKALGNFRPIDCWVKTDSHIFAYWIFDTQLKLARRETLFGIFKKLSVEINWIFAYKMLHRINDNGWISLSPTEREFMKTSKYDEMYSYNGKSLHYLDYEKKTLITYRGLHLVHAPQMHHGTEISSGIGSVLISPKLGEFVHRGEYERLEEYRRKKNRQERLQRKTKREKKQKTSFLSPMRSPVGQERKVRSLNPEDRASKTDPESFWEKQNKTVRKMVLVNKTGVCIYCGKKTSDWWYYDNKTGKCKCTACRTAGKAT